jgi:hypothetical protein
MGRFMSPDWASNPQAVPYSTLNDPQSLNLYAYVLNNPLRAVDSDGHNGYTLDGQDISDSLANALLGSGGAVQCPNNICSGFNNKVGQFSMYTADDAAAGYVTFADMNAGLNSWNGVFLSDAAWQTYLAPYKDKMQAMIVALTGLNESDLAIGDVKGGNANFTIGSDDARNAVAAYIADMAHGCLSSGSQTRCSSGSGSLHFEIEGDNINVHLDSANPFGNFLGINPLGLLIHFTKDVVGGEVFTPQGVSH